MKKLLFYLKYLSPIILCGVLVGVTNFVPNTLLSGGDNLHPEFDFGLNIQRSIFGTWQEYQGVGLLGGMGHSADLLRQLFLLCLSMFIPEMSLRYTWTILMLVTGGIGAYFLVKQFLGEVKYGSNLVAVLAGIFYMLNLGTLQSFYIPFEVFTAHFGFLPWLILFTVCFLKRQNWTNWWFVLIIMLLSTPSGVVPTLFLVYWIMAVILVFGLGFSRSMLKWGINSAKSIMALLTAFVITNGYWLFNFLYFTFSSSAVNVSSKINQMSTEVIFLQNKKYGDIADVLWQKSFWFDGFEPNINNIPSYMMEPWIKHLSNQTVTAVEWVLVSLIMLGVVISLFSSSSVRRVFGILWIIIFGFLATATFPFEHINSLLRDNLPLFGQIFRFTFTKFSIGFSLLSSLSLAFALYWLINRFHFLENKFRQAGLFLAVLIAMLFVAWPTFQGEFFYNRVQVKQPYEYSQVFEYFRTQPYDLRIANFPQSNFWSWEYYRWGYSGSGFLWYGINQPILDRAFDPWSSLSENYYLEVTQAVYGQNKTLLQSVFEKYHVGYILIDENIVDNFSTKVSYYNELKALLESMGVKKDKQFGGISIYKVDLKNKTVDFVRAEDILPRVNQYAWTNFDVAHQVIGDYASTLGRSSTFYVFRSLVKHKDYKNENLEISESDNSLWFKSNIGNQSGFLNIKDWWSSEKRTMYKLSVFEDRGQSYVQIELQIPRIYVDGKLVSREKAQKIIFAFPSGSKLELNTNTGDNFYVDKPNFIETGYILNGQDFEIIVKDTNHVVLKEIVLTQDELGEMTSFQNIQISGNKELVVEIPMFSNDKYAPKIDLSKMIVKSCDINGGLEYSSSIDNGIYNLKSKNSKICLSVDYPHIWHNQGYLSIIESSHKQGLPLLYWVNNDTDDYQPINLYLKEKSQFEVISPLDDFGLGYSFHFDNLSIGNQVTQNELKSFSIYPIPYSWLMDLNISSKTSVPASSKTVDAKKINSSLYEVDLNAGKQTVILEQAYDSGWKMYQVDKSSLWIARIFPMFGQELNNHVMVNNLVNGWEVDSDKNVSLLIVYLPQYLEYLGFGILLIALGFGVVIGGFNLTRSWILKRDSYFKVR